MPGDERPLAGITGEKLADGGGNRSVFGIEIGRRLLVPRLEILRGPGQGTIQVTKVAGVETSGGERGGDARAVDLVLTDTTEEGVGGMGHMTVVTGGPGTAGGVVGVIRGGVLGLLVAIETNPVVGGFRVQLVIR